jgi:hypothetical protein
MAYLRLCKGCQEQIKPHEISVHATGGGYIHTKCIRYSWNKSR